MVCTQTQALEEILNTLPRVLSLCASSSSYMYCIHIHLQMRHNMRFLLIFCARLLLRITRIAYTIRKFDNLTMCIYISTICIYATHTYCEIRACMLYMHTVFVIVIVTLSKLQFKLAPKFAPLSYRLKWTDRFLYYFALIAMQYATSRTCHDCTHVQYNKYMYNTMDILIKCLVL